MSWQERDYADAEDPRRRYGRPGGDWQGVRPTFDNPMSWSLPLGRFAGIAIRVHVVFLILIVVELGTSLRTDPRLGFALAALLMACLFVIVLLHELGHCFACRWTRGEANEILMWPLGGLAFCRPASPWTAHLATAVGGPLVNVVIGVVLAPILLLICADGWAAALPNPFSIEIPTLADGRQPWWLLALHFVHFVNMVLLAFNLLPIFPLDGGRICQSLLWPRLGYVRSMKVAVYTGYVGAIVLFIAGAISSAWMLIAIACFGGLTCYFTLKQLEFTDEFMQPADIYAESLWGGDEDDADGKSKKPSRSSAVATASRAERTAEAEAAELDRILEKIASTGMGSLSGRERKLLRQVTERRQRES